VATVKQYEQRARSPAARHDRDFLQVSSQQAACERVVDDGRAERGRVSAARGVEPCSDRNHRSEGCHQQRERYDPAPPPFAHGLGSSQHSAEDMRRSYPTPVRTYAVTTFGCQMNAHDSERIKGMLEELGLGEATSADEADVIVFNTCTIREKPDTKLAAYLGDAAARKRAHPDMVIAVGGCYAEAQRERLFSLYPQVDVAFGPGTIPHLSEWLGAGGFGVPRSAFGTGEERAFAATLPMHRERSFQAWVQISMGCNSTCSYCIVPAVRGREVSRRPGEVLAEVTRLAREGVRELTLLGQNVNSWGRDLLPDIHTEFGELLRACDAVDGIERIRFTSPHPKDFRRPVIEAMAECAAVCEHAHLPLQSGSTRILKIMRRTYSRERYLRLVDELRAAIPDLALTTDIIVGFPGETEDDFRETLEVVEEVGFDSAFTFVYSPRVGTDAAAMSDQVPDEVKRERIERLVELVQRLAASRNAERIGRVEEVLVEGPSRTDPAYLRGRTRRNTTVNFAGPAVAGELVDVVIDRATSTTLGGVQAAVAVV
jgi:tRNA-2-methylthio-N6-dimethylallyladenosine synthase